MARRKRQTLTKPQVIQQINPETGRTDLRTGYYEPIRAHAYWQHPRDLPWFNFDVIRLMLWDPAILLALKMRAAPLASVQFAYQEGEQWTEGIEAHRPEVGAFVHRQLMKIWQNHIDEIASSQIWGWSSGEVTLKLSRYKLVEVARMEPRQARDCKVMTVDGSPCGVQISRVTHEGKVDLQFPNAWFHNHDPEAGEYYGRSVLLGAYSPWADKWLDGGALDVRRLFMHKDAYGGSDLGYPEGSTLIGEQDVPNRDIARQIVEQLAAGGVTTRPSTRDENGNEKWPLTRAVVPSNPSHILQYPQDLDAEIRRGIGVPDDVIDNDGGGAWAGKRIPLAAFYASLDSWVRRILTDLNEQVIEPLVAMNFGGLQDYEIRHKPLAKQAMEQQGNAGEGMGEGEGMFGGESQSPFGQMPQQQQQFPRMARMSLNPIEAVGEGVLSAAELVKAARSVIRMELNRAPEGGVEIDGKFYEGGEFLPGKDSKGSGGKVNAKFGGGGAKAIQRVFERLKKKHDKYADREDEKNPGKTFSANGYDNLNFDEYGNEKATEQFGSERFVDIGSEEGGELDIDVSKMDNNVIQGLLKELEKYAQKKGEHQAIKEFGGQEFVDALRGKKAGIKTNQPEVKSKVLKTKDTPAGKIEVKHTVKKGTSPLEGLYPSDDWKNIPYFEHTYVVTKNGKEIETFKQGMPSPDQEDEDTLREVKRYYNRKVKDADRAGEKVDSGSHTGPDGEVYDWSIEHDGDGYYRLTVGGYEETGLTKKQAERYLKKELADIEKESTRMSLRRMARWITVKPNGEDEPGRPVMIDKDGKVIAGVGGALDGKTLSPKSKESKGPPPKSQPAEAAGEKSSEKSPDSPDSLLTNQTKDDNLPVSDESSNSQTQEKTMKRDIFSKWDELKAIKPSEGPLGLQPTTSGLGYKRAMKIDPSVKMIEATLSPSGETIVEGDEDLKPGDIVIAIGPSSSKSVQYAFAHKIESIYNRSKYGKTGKKVVSKLMMREPVAILYGDNLNSDKSGSDR